MSKTIIEFCVVAAVVVLVMLVVVAECFVVEVVADFRWALLRVTFCVSSPCLSTWKLPSASAFLESNCGFHYLLTCVWVSILEPSINCFLLHQNDSTLAKQSHHDCQ